MGPSMVVAMRKRRRAAWADGVGSAYEAVLSVRVWMVMVGGGRSVVLGVGLLFASRAGWTARKKLNKELA